MIKKFITLLILGICFGIFLVNDKQLDAIKLSAQQGNVHAQFNLGLSYANGDGVEQNYTEAIQWYRMAVENKLPQAAYNLGYLYYHGQGVPQDREEAEKLYRLAMEQGLPDLAAKAGPLYPPGSDFKDVLK